MPPASTAADAVALTLQGAGASYKGLAVLRDIDLAITAGQRVALVGESGAGKSTLLRLLYQQFPDQVALVPQDFGLVRTLSVFHNVYMGQLNRRSTLYNLLNLCMPLAREVGPIRELLNELNLADKLFIPVGELSGGQQQRTAVARALHQGGGALLADEPVSALDEPNSHLVLKAICARYQTVVLAMHDVRMALAYTDRIVGLRDGAIHLDAPTASLSLEDLGRLYSA